MRPDQHPNFAALQEEWRQKLIDDGFVDIESPPGEDENGPYGELLAIRAVTKYRYNMTARTADLFTIAEQWMDTCRWTSRRERSWFYAWVRGESVEDIFRYHPAIPSSANHRAFREARIIIQREMLKEWQAAPDDPDTIPDPTNDSPEGYL